MRAKFVIVSRPRDRSVVLNELLSKEPAGSDTVLLLHECDPRAVLPTDAIVKSEGLAVDVVLIVSRVEVIGEIEDFHSNSRTFMV